MHVSLSKEAESDHLEKIKKEKGKSAATNGAVSLHPNPRTKKKIKRANEQKTGKTRIRTDQAVKWGGRPQNDNGKNERKERFWGLLEKLARREEIRRAHPQRKEKMKIIIEQLPLGLLTAS